MGGRSKAYLIFPGSLSGRGFAIPVRFAKLTSEISSVTSPKRKTMGVKNEKDHLKATQKLTKKKAPPRRVSEGSGSDLPGFWLPGEFLGGNQQKHLNGAVVRFQVELFGALSHRQVARRLGRYQGRFFSHQ